MVTLGTDDNNNNNNNNNDNDNDNHRVVWCSVVQYIEKTSWKVRGWENSRQL